MAARSVVVASDLPGYAAVAGGHAAFVPPGDADALAATLGGALADAVAGRGLGSPAALDGAVAHAAQYAMLALAARYETLYERAREIRIPAHG